MVPVNIIQLVVLSGGHLRPVRTMVAFRSTGILGPLWSRGVLPTRARA